MLLLLLHTLGDRVKRQGDPRPEHHVPSEDFAEKEEERAAEAEKARGLTAIVGAQSAAALSGKGEFAGWHEGETLLAVSGGERGCEACAALDAAMARLGAAIASTQPALASKLLLATMDGAVRQPAALSPHPCPRPTRAKSACFVCTAGECAAVRRTGWCGGGRGGRGRQGHHKRCAWRRGCGCRYHSPAPPRAAT